MSTYNAKFDAVSQASSDPPLATDNWELRFGSWYSTLLKLSPCDGSASLCNKHLSA